MYLARIERELVEGTPWDSLSMMPLETEINDCWEIQTGRHQGITQQFWSSRLRFWRKLTFK